MTVENKHNSEKGQKGSSNDPIGAKNEQTIVIRDT